MKIRMTGFILITSRTSCRSLRPSWRACWCNHRILPSSWWLHRWRRSWTVQSCDLLRVISDAALPLAIIILTCGLVNLGHVDLDAGVILGRQDTVAGRAFPGKREDCNVTLLMILSDISYQQDITWMKCLEYLFEGKKGVNGYTQPITPPLIQYNLLAVFADLLLPGDVKVNVFASLVLHSGW